MSKTTIQVDLIELNSEISELRTKIDQLLNLKKYVESKLTISPKAPSIVPKVQAVSRIVEPGTLMGVSEFIITYLTDNGKKDTKYIIEAYAKYTGKLSDNVRGNVSNALSRLKKDTRINNEENPGGRKAGSAWFITN